MILVNHHGIGLAPILNDIKNLGKYGDFNATHNISHYTVFQNTHGEGDEYPPYTQITIAYFKKGVNSDRNGYKVHTGTTDEYNNNKGWSPMLSRAEAFKVIRSELAKYGIKRQAGKTICYKVG